MRFVFGFLAAAGAATAIFGAPVASAQPNCVDTTIGTTQCQSPGNVQINATPPIEEEPFVMPYWDGVYSGGGYQVPFDEGRR